MVEQSPGIPYWSRFLRNFVAQPTATRFFSGFVARVDLPILRLTKGRFSPLGYLSGWPIVTLVSIGAKSGFKLYRERANRDIPIMVLEPTHRLMDE
jgi:hypothetical protein